MHQWYFARQGQTKGPYTTEQLRALVGKGGLLPEDLVCQAGAPKWVPAREVPDLFPAAAPPPASPSPVASRSLLEPLLALPKPILFGIFGGIGGLLGAMLLGELLWVLLSPSTVRALQPPPQIRLGIPSAVRVYQGGKNHFVVQLARDGFKGPVQVEGEQLPAGVTLVAATIPEDSTEADIEVQAGPNLPLGNQTLTIRGHAKNVQDFHGAIELNVEAQPAQLRLSAPAEVAVIQGGKTRFHIKIARHHFTGPVKLQFQGLPDGITLADRTAPESRTDEEFTVLVPESSNLGEWPILVIGTLQDNQGKAKATTKFTLRVRPPPIPQADIIFVLDLTLSMQPAIDGIKQGIQNFANELEKSRIDSRIALVGFRDIEGDNEHPFVMLVKGKPFTRDYQAFRQEVQTLRPFNSGGNLDIPESCLQGLALAGEQPFREHASRVLLLITDAPAKIHPNEKPSTVKETIDELRRQKISQLHFMVRDEDYKLVYNQFKTFPGKFFDLNNAMSGDAFSAILPKLSKEISTLTIAALPRTPPEAQPPPALPVESGSALPPPPPVAPVEVVKAVQSTQAYIVQDRNRLLLAIAVWTMAMAGGISLLILAGQRYYACRCFVGFVDGCKGIGGGFLAGLAGGAAGQHLFQSTAGGTAWEAASRLLGWGLLGGLIGTGMSFVVPNLKWWRGLVGGLVGGLLGAVAFVLISLAVASFLGRWIGAGILGFFIGLMVALAELAFRRYWLEVAFSPGEVRTVTLGSIKVSLGGDERRVAIAVPGGPPIALRYWIEGERVLCQEVMKERTTEVVPGDRKTVGKVAVTLCSAAHEPKAGYTLQLSNGVSFRLVAGFPLTAEDLPGLQAQGKDGVVAVVSSRPNDPQTLLLRNRSKQTWTLRGANGSQQGVEPGRSLELSFTGSISFGQVQGTLRRDVR
jgi:Ca-activated chloride channel family protein